MRWLTLLSLRSASHDRMFYSDSRRCIILVLLFLAFLVKTGQAQSPLTVKGTVARQNGELLSGVSVIVKGTDQGTVTQGDGSFQLEVPLNGVLQISNVGYIA
ncbi:MAG TPA: carboxypeptidase-like regulatory domain-containing protein, partial [Chitinophagaceae bacterium]|nr:carboxypeptidase-like regulatory domain-containing protein [Chitinophagaceae bacterium]